MPCCAGRTRFRSTRRKRRLPRLGRKVRSIDANCRAPPHDSTPRSSAVSLRPSINHDWQTLFGDDSTMFKSAGHLRSACRNGHRRWARHRLSDETRPRSPAGLQTFVLPRRWLSTHAALPRRCCSPEIFSGHEYCFRKPTPGLWLLPCAATWALGRTRCRSSSVCSLQPSSTVPNSGTDPAGA